MYRKQFLQAQYFIVPIAFRGFAPRPAPRLCSWTSLREGLPSPRPSALPLHPPTKLQLHDIRMCIVYSCLQCSRNNCARKYFCDGDVYKEANITFCGLIVYKIGLARLEFSDSAGGLRGIVCIRVHRHSTCMRPRGCSRNVSQRNVRTS